VLFFSFQKWAKNLCLGGLEGKNIKDKCWDPLSQKEINPHRNTSSSAKIWRYSQKCVLQSLARKV